MCVHLCVYMCHSYYMDGQRASVRDFLSYSVMDQLVEEAILSKNSFM